MKRTKNLIAAAVLLAMVAGLLTGCTKTENPPSGTEPAVPSETAVEPAPPSATPTPLPLPEYPVIDGSSSTQLMHAAIRARLTDFYAPVSHSQTYGALERLVPGNETPADIILAVKYYDETLQDVESRGADLIITPIAKEGFVFLLNANNPVESLTQQQIKDIYSGKITNWSEVGGNDEAIVLFQRNPHSGSQTAMLDFMGGVPLADDGNVSYSESMLGMLGWVGESNASIGYNIYSWTVANDLGIEIKPLAVDGVTPSNETIADGSYPLTVYTYSYTNRDNAKGKALTEWLLTDDGQKVIASAGYVGIGGELPAEELFDSRKDERDSSDAAMAFYKENGWGDLIYPMEYLTSTPRIRLLSGDGWKDVTVAWVFSYGIDNPETPGMGTLYTRFIVLTKEKGGAFEVIREGELLEGNSYGETMTPGDTENHSPPEGLAGEDALMGFASG